MSIASCRRTVGVVRIRHVIRCRWRCHIRVRRVHGRTKLRAHTRGHPRSVVSCHGGHGRSRRRHRSTRGGYWLLPPFLRKTGSPFLASVARAPPAFHLRRHEGLRGLHVRNHERVIARLQTVKLGGLSKIWRMSRGSGISSDGRCGR